MFNGVSDYITVNISSPNTEDLRNFHNQKKLDDLLKLIEKEKRNLNSKTPIAVKVSPDINDRTDAWGGSVENRARIHLETIKRCRQEVGDDFPISVKMNSADFQKGGFAPDDSIRVAQMLENAGVDIIEISGGTYEQPKLIGVDDLTINPKRSEQRKESTIAREAYFL